MAANMISFNEQEAEAQKAQALKFLDGVRDAIMQMGAGERLAVVVTPHVVPVYSDGRLPCDPIADWAYMGQVVSFGFNCVPEVKVVSS